METITNGYRNKNMAITFREDVRKGGRSCITIRDLKDTYNDTTGFTTNIRNIKKAWAFITQICNAPDLRDDLDFRDMLNVLNNKFNLKVHTYCAMD